MNLLIDMAENGWLPDELIRFDIRQLDKKRLHEEDHGVSEQPHPTRDQFITEMRQSPMAINTHKTNEQHYELPAAFFEKVLGRHLKYSGCYWEAAAYSQPFLRPARLSCRPFISR